MSLTSPLPLPYSLVPTSLALHASLSSIISPLPFPSHPQLGRIYLDMLNVYKVLSENISTAVAANGRL